MEDFFDFANPNKKYVQKYVPTGLVNGRVAYSDNESSSEEEDIDDGGVEYVREYQEREDKLYATAVKAQEDGTLTCVDDVDDIVDPEHKMEINKLKKEEMVRIFNDFNFSTSVRSKNMQIDGHKEEIISLLKIHSVVVIQGPTGCGKTTQVPQFILDDCREKQIPCNIIVTQPRRIAAISVAKRVCDERGWGIGTVCGYQVGLEKMVTPDTILSYVTTGVLLQKLIMNKNLHQFTHIIIDEVHERTQEMDFLMLLIRKFLYTNSFHVKVILMSATFNTERFCYYFRTHSEGVKILAPSVFVTKNSASHVTSIYYADQLSALGFIPILRPDEPQLKPELLDILVKLIRLFDRFDEVDKINNTKHIGNVLVFLPGIYEIEEAYSRLNRSWEGHFKESSEAIPWVILPLHSSITNTEQRKVFLPPPEGKRKIILSTNIAESSITVSDVEYVIDFCLTKTMTVDPISQYNSLKLEWATHVNCTQRSGRVGRVSDGRVYRLVQKNFYDELSEDVLPEILRAPLERVVLSTKLLDFADSPKAILALAIQPPDLRNIESTILNLKEVGALLLTCRGECMKSDGDLTFLGRLMANLPLDVYVAKMICLGYIFSCLHECIIMAAGCSLSSIFSIPFQERLRSYTNKLRWADGSSSDLIAHLNLYKTWERNKRTGAFERHQNERQWCEKYFLSYRSIKEWEILVTELTDRLKHMGIEDSVGPQRVGLSRMDMPLFLKVVMCGSFYPNYFKRSCAGGQVDEREAVRIINGLNPMNTVYFTNLNPGQPGPLYAKRIKEYLKPCSTNMNVHFDSTSKIYVSFLDNCAPRTINIDGSQFLTAMPGKVANEVYKAVRMRQISQRNSCEIKVLSVKDAWQRAQDLGIAEKSSGGIFSIIKKPVQGVKTILPGIDESTIFIRVAHFIDAGHFYAHHIDNVVDATLIKIEQLLNDEKKPLTPTETVKIGDVYAAKFKADNRFYRCRVMGIIPFNKNELKASILFIDFGNTDTISPKSLHDIPDGMAKETPAQAIECILSNVQPSLCMNSRAIWSTKANNSFKELVENVELIGKVYSVVNGIVSLELFKRTQGKSFNEYLIDCGYAQISEESFLSKENNAKRATEQSYKSMTSESKVLDLNEDQYLTVSQDVEPPSWDDCSYTMQLRGPFSPLEMSIYSVNDSDSARKVTIDGNSVNAVLLDSEPQDPHERLVVATNINQSSTSTGLTIRHTTLMPNIHGFPALMSLLFCPKMEPKPIEDGTCFGALLCGLGPSGNTGKAMYPSHDMVVTLDTEINQADLTSINELRYWMNQSIQAMTDKYNKIESVSTNIEICQRELNERILSLLSKRRKAQERHYVKDAHKWGKFQYQGGKLEVLDSGMTSDWIWYLHSSMVLRPVNDENVLIKKHIENMHDMAKNTRPMTEITCQLCKVEIYSMAEMRTHLVSSIHKELEAKLKEEQNGN